ncbi:MAG: insulinase family protein [Deltaproteobacteria bacterium]|nr:insulinase family protein [Deltaproteobacteria bacterium]
MSEAPIPASRIRLGNGLTLVVEEQHHAPVVALQAWVHVGSADEPEAVAGIAHVHEHMLFKGTAKRGVGEIARTVEGGGGEINAWTSYDQTVYHLVQTATELDVGLDILSDVLCASAFDAGELGRELEVVLEEIRRAEDMPARRVTNALFRQAFQVHPYGRPVIGTAATVAALTRERILEFYRRHYRPDRVTLVVVGDVVTAAVVAAVQRHFGDWIASGLAPESARAVEPAIETPRIQVLFESVKEARLAVSWHLPPIKHPDIAAVDALAVILGHGDSSRLTAEVRHRRELVNDIYAYAYTPRDPGLFMVGAGLKAEKARAALAATLSEIERVRRVGVSRDELDKARMVILSEAAYQRETVQGEARKLGFFEVVAGDFAFEARYAERLRALGVDDIRAAARRYLHAAPALVVQAPEGTAGLEPAVLAAAVAAGFEARTSAQVKHRSAGALAVTKVELASGATLLVQRQEGPAVAVRAAALGGLRHENAASCGTAGLFAATWGRATRALSPEAFAERTALLGGSISTFAGRNTVGVRGEFVRDAADEGMALFLEALLSSVVTDDDLDRERAVALERIKNRHDNPAGVAFEVFAKALYPNHPYGLRLIGTETSLASLTVADLIAVRERFLTSSRLVLAVVGDVDVDRVVDRFALRLEVEPSPDLPAVSSPDPRPAAPIRERYPLDKQQAHVIIGGLGTTIGDDDRYALEVLTAILSGQSGRLFLDLRDQQSLAYSISSSSVEGCDPGHWLVHVGTSPDKVTRAIDGVRAHLARISNEPVSAEELARAKRYLIGTHAIDLQRAGSRAMLMALGERYGLGYQDYSRYADRIGAISAARLCDAAKHYFAPAAQVEVVVGPAAALADSGASR